MDIPISYRQMKSGEETAACELVIHVFNTFVAPGYAPRGVREFLKYVNPDAMRERSDGSHFTMIALVKQKIVGVIEMRTLNHVSLLFVDPQYQRLGISRELLHRSIKVCRDHEPGLTDISVNSSPYAVPIYEKLGFVQQQSEQVINGIRFVPMQLPLSA